MACTSVFNLVRNSRVFFTTNLTSASIPNAVALTAHTTATTSELQVLEGFSMSQNTENATITISEAGVAPTRGQRSFNTALAPVDFSFSTYIRPYQTGGVVQPEERFLWNALMSPVAIATNGTPTTMATAATVTAAARGAASGATSDTLTLTCTASTLTTGTVPSATVLVIGEVVTIVGLGGANAQDWNVPARVVSANATSVVLTMLEAPPAAAGTTATVVASQVKLQRSAWTENVAVAPIAAYASSSFAYSNVNQLQPFGMIFIVDGVTYTVDNCALDGATIDFGLDGIATIAWTGKGTVLNQLATTATLSNAADPVVTGGLTGTFKGKNTAGQFITNKLSTVSLVSNVAGVSGTSYVVALTGGSISIANNLAYVTPTILGVVNKAIGYYTGTRAITGSMTAYLKTGAGNTTSTLLKDILNSGNPLVEPTYALSLSVGGASNAVKVELEMNGVTLTTPTVETADLVTTTINFTAQSYCSDISANQFDIANTNDMTVRYYSV
jgi:hypothetical protein